MFRDWQKVLVLASGLFCGFSGGMVHAGLEWQTREVVLKPEIGQKQVSTSFEFKNTGQKPVKIKQLVNSCDCTTAELEKKEYLPGESGKVEATFVIGERQNLQEKIITVMTDDPEESQVRLLMKVYVPVILSIEPRFVSWSQGEKEPQAKTIHIKNMTKNPIKVLAASSLLPPALLEAAATQPRLLPQFKYELETLKEGWEYNLTFTPKDMELPMGLTVELKTDLPEGFPVYRVHAMVQPAVWAPSPSAEQPTTEKSK